MTSIAIDEPTRTPTDIARFADLVARHAEKLSAATAAISARSFWSAYPESPSVRYYGEDAAETGRAAYEQHLGSRFDLGMGSVDSWVGDEVSPFGPALGVTYGHVPVPELIAGAARSASRWRALTPAARASVCVEIVDRINARSFELAHAVMHTTGQAFVMAFQAGGPHAQDRALEAIAFALAEQTRFARSSVWEKAQGKRPPIRMAKEFSIVPRGIGLVIGCNTFPTWNSYPGLFASLATGNAVMVKPHPAAVLPLAITVAVAREVLDEFGLDRDLVTLAVEAPGERLAALLAARPEVGIIDFTGSSAFGNWLEDTARHARVYTEKAGVNTVIVESTDDYLGMLQNLAFSLSLYSGQMCTTPQNILIPQAGILTESGSRTVAQFAADLAAAIDSTLGADAQAVEVLGAIVSDDVLERLETFADGADQLARVAVASRAIVHPVYPAARVRTPLVVTADVDEAATYSAECFGPVSFLVTVPEAAEAVAVFCLLGRDKGALTASVYSSNEAFLADVRAAALDVGVALSENLTQGVFVNQSAAFSDLHGTGANAAANSSYTDGDFVAGRFHTVAFRRHILPE